MNISPKRVSKVGIVSFDLSLCNSNKPISIDTIGSSGSSSSSSICEPLRYALDHITKIYNIDNYSDSGIYNDFINDSINLSSSSSSSSSSLSNDHNDDHQYYIV